VTRHRGGVSIFCQVGDHGGAFEESPARLLHPSSRHRYGGHELVMITTTTVHDQRSLGGEVEEEEPQTHRRRLPLE
jgi:hypothetical protein